MLLFIKNFLKDLYLTVNCWVERHSLKIAGGLVIAIILLLLFGCAGNHAISNKVQSEGPGYCKWEAAPSYIAKDFITDPEGFGLMKGFKFFGDQGQNCYLLMIDLPKADGTCDLITAVCETGTFDTRHGPDTPLVRVVGKWPCNRWDAIIDHIIQYAEKNKS